MADTKQDLLGLEYSPSFELQGIQEADVNLELPPAPGGTATVYGTVTDGTAPLADATLALGAIAGVLTTLVGTDVTPLAGAKITLKDQTDTVVASTDSADDGEFLFYDVADGVYTMLASAEGYLTSAPWRSPSPAAPSPT